jgi:hypothetical protein
MLIPRFTIRWLLLLTTVCSFFFFVVAFAVRGSAWAGAISIAVAGLVGAFILFGAFFGFAFVLAALFGLIRNRPTGGTPFATAEPPVQIIPPEEPE